MKIAGDFKFQARNKSRFAFRNENLECSVLRCTNKGEIHHIDYNDWEAVIPLCSVHHNAIHGLNFWLEKAQTGITSTLERLAKAVESQIASSDGTTSHDVSCALEMANAVLFHVVEKARVG